VTHPSAGALEVAGEREAPEKEFAIEENRPFITPGHAVRICYRRKSPIYHARARGEKDYVFSSLEEDFPRGPDANGEEFRVFRRSVYYEY
jgi:hypothetical protein